MSPLVPEPSGQDQEQSSTGEKKKQKTRNKRAKLTTKVDKKRSFLNVVLQTNVDQFQIPGDKGQSSVVMTQGNSKLVALPLKSIGYFYQLKIKSMRPKWTIVEDLLPNGRKGGVDPSCVWMLRLPASNDSPANPLATHEEKALAAEAEKDKKSKKVPTSESCQIRRPSGVAWRDVPVDFSDMWCPAVSTGNRSYGSMEVKTTGPLIQISLTNASVADINKTKMEVSRLLLAWEFTLDKFEYSENALGRFRQTSVLRCVVRIPLLLDATFSNRPPQIISPAGGIFDSDKMRIEFAVERQTVSFDTLVIKKFWWRTLVPAEMLQDTSMMGPLSFTLNIPERIYSPARIPFEVTPYHATAPDRSVAPQDKTSEAGIRSRHFVLLASNLERQSPAPGSTPLVTPFHRIFAMEVKFKDGGLCFTGEMSAHGLEQKFNLVNVDSHKLLIGNRVETQPNMGLTAGSVVPLNQVLGFITSFYYGTSTHPTRPFFWRLFTNIEGIMSKTNPIMNPMRLNASKIITFLNLKIESTKNKKNKKEYNSSQPFHYDINASTFYASSCALAYSKPLPQEADLSSDVNQTSKRFLVGNTTESSPEDVSVFYMNVPDFFPSLELKHWADSVAEGARKSAAVKKAALRKCGFAPNRLIWGLGFKAYLEQDQPYLRGIPMLKITHEEHYTHSKALRNGTIFRQLVSRILKDTRTCAFNSIIWFPGASSMPREKFMNIVAQAEGASKTFIESSRSLASHLASGNPPALAASEEKTTTQVMNEMPHLPHVKLVIKNSDAANDVCEFKIAPAMLAVYSKLGYAHGHATAVLSKDKDVIRCDLVLCEEAGKFIQAIIHKEEDDAKRVYAEILSKDRAESIQAVHALENHRQHSIATGYLGHVLAAFLMDCLKLADFLQSDRLCDRIVSYIIYESGLCCTDIDKANLYEYDSLTNRSQVEGRPCASFYTSNYLNRGVMCTKSSVLNSFAVFAAIYAAEYYEEETSENPNDGALAEGPSKATEKHILLGRGLSSTKGLDFLYIAISAHLGPTADFTHWIFGQDLVDRTGYLENLTEELVNRFFRLIKLFYWNNDAFIRGAYQLHGGLPMHDLNCTDEVHKKQQQQNPNSNQRVVADEFLLEELDAGLESGEESEDDG